MIRILATFLLVGSAAAAQTFTDGIATYTEVAPIEGLWIPHAVFKPGWTVPPAEVVAQGRKMPAEDLAAFPAEAAPPLPPDRDLALLRYPNQGSHVLLWEGMRDPDEQVLPRTWNGEHWMPYWASDGRREPLEVLLAGLEGEESVWILLDHSGGGGPLRTRRLRVAKFPGLDHVLRAALQEAAVVLHVPPTRPRHPTAPFEIVRGAITREQAAELPGSSPDRRNRLLFFATEGKALVPRFTYDVSTTELEGLHGPIRDPGRTVKDDWVRDIRWHLERATIPEGKRAAVNVRARPDAVSIELVAAEDLPFEPFSRPVSRSQRDGGHPGFGFLVRQDGIEVMLRPKGRFGVDSIRPEKPEACEELGADYRFHFSSRGVVSLEILPRARPFSASVEAHVSIAKDILGRDAEHIRLAPVAIELR